MFSSTDLSLLCVALAMPYALVMAAPGPNFLVVLHASLAPPAQNPLAAAFGVAVGASLAVAAASCIAFLIPNSRIVETGGILIFSFCLLRTAAGLIRGRMLAANTGDTWLAVVDRREKFGRGLVTAFLNPVTLAFFVSFFLANPHFCSIQATSAICAMVFVMAALWFGLLGLAFAQAGARKWLMLDNAWVKHGIALALVAYAVLALLRLRT